MFKVISILTIVAICDSQDTYFRESYGVRQNSGLQQQNSGTRYYPNHHQHSDLQQNSGVRHYREFQQNSALRQNSGLEQNSDFQRNSRSRNNPELERRSERRQDFEVQQNSGSRQDTGHRQHSEPQLNPELQQNSGRRRHIGRSDPLQDTEVRRNNGFGQNDNRQQNSGVRQSTERNPDSRTNSGIRQNTRLRTTEIPENPESKTGRVPVYAPDKCPENQLLYPEEKEDKWICDCGPRYLYYPPRDGCFSAYRQGPCSRGQHLILKRNKSTAECTLNPCKDGYARYNGKCYELGKPNGPCPSAEDGGGVLNVNSTTFAVECVTGTNKLSLFDFPPQKCPPGSKRDSQNKCRQNWNN